MEELELLLHALGLKTSNTRSFRSNRAAPEPCGNPILLVISVGSAYKIGAARGSKQTAALGCAKLYTGDIRGLPPGEEGAAWLNKASAYALRITGRQRGAGAEQLTLGCETDAVYHVDFADVAGWLSTGCPELDSGDELEDKRRIKLVICDSYASGVNVLQEELDEMVEDMPNMTRVLDIVNLYNMAKPTDAPAEVALQGAEQTLAAAVILALKTAMTAAPVPELPRRRFSATVTRGFRSITGKLRAIEPWSTGVSSRAHAAAVLPAAVSTTSVVADNAEQTSIVLAPDAASTFNTTQAFALLATDAQDSIANSTEGPTLSLTSPSLRTTESVGKKASAIEDAQSTPLPATNVAPKSLPTTETTFAALQADADTHQPPAEAHVVVLGKRLPANAQTPTAAVATSQQPQPKQISQPPQAVQSLASVQAQYTKSPTSAQEAIAPAQSGQVPETVTNQTVAARQRPTAVRGNPIIQPNAAVQRVPVPQSSGPPPEQQSNQAASVAQFATAQQKPLPRQEKQNARSAQPTINQTVSAAPAAPQPRSLAPSLTGLSNIYADPPPPGFDDNNPTLDDSRELSRSRDKVFGIPDRIKRRVVRYTEMTKLLETWLVTGATSLKYPDLARHTYEFRRVDGGTIIRRTRIKSPTTNYEVFAKYIARTMRFPPNIANNVGYLVRTRTFVSDFYKNVQNKEPKLPAECEVAKKTDRHVYFTDMLIRLREIFMAAQT
ncbi:hypothetical protein LTR56_005509 [Elasticomyces elasticus]|nr:hypothetical protein LTR56_005509 [Elasticomyces elasticus]